MRISPARAKMAPFSSVAHAAASPSQDFGLTIDIDKLIRETDADGSGQVDYPEFKAMMA